VSVQVNAVNDAPVGVDDSFSTGEDTPLSQAAPGVLANDTDAEGDPLTAQLVGGPSHAAEFTLSVDGSFQYTPEEDYNGADAFTYRAYDGTGYSDVATVEISVSAVNDAPAAVNDAAFTSEDSPVTVHVLDNDSDVEIARGETGLHPGHYAHLRVVAVGVPEHGSVSTDGANVMYTPTVTFRGPQVFTYTLSDGLLTREGQVSVLVNPVQLITLDKDDSPDPVPAGWRIRYLIRAYNSCQTVLTNVVVTDVLALGTNFHSCTQGCEGLYTSPIVSWTIPSLLPGSYVDLELIVDTSITLRGAISNMAYASVFGTLVAQAEETTTVLTPTATPTEVPSATPTELPMQTPTATPTATSTPGLGGLEVYAWNDLNRDGQRAATDPPLKGAVIEVFAQEPEVGGPSLLRFAPLVSCVTGADGICTFQDLPAGDYWVVETNPHGMYSSTPDTVQVTVLADQLVRVEFGDWRWQVFLPVIRRKG